MMLLMLCLVFASAGPGVPSVGDVFSMSPTMAYGADPHMLHSAPDWGSGFVLGGEELHVKFIESSECVHCGPGVHPGCTGSDCARSQVANGRPAVVGGSDRGHFEDIFWKKTCLLLLHHLRSGTTHRCRTSSVRPFLASTTARVAVNRAGGSGCICPRL